MRGGLCRKQTCTVTVIHYYLYDRQSHCSSRRSDSQIFAENKSRFSPVRPWVYYNRPL